jgi:hypothetical protein
MNKLFNGIAANGCETSYLQKYIRLSKIPFKLDEDRPYWNILYSALKKSFNHLNKAESSSTCTKTLRPPRGWHL